jgi:hypothetical protein
MMVFHDVMDMNFYGEMFNDNMCEHVVYYYSICCDDNDVVFS